MGWGLGSLGVRPESLGQARIDTGSNAFAGTCTVAGRRSRNESISLWTPSSRGVLRNPQRGHGERHVAAGDLTRPGRAVLLHVERCEQSAITSRG